MSIIKNEEQRELIKNIDEIYDKWTISKKYRSLYSECQEELKKDDLDNRKTSVCKTSVDRFKSICGVMLELPAKERNDLLNNILLFIVKKQELIEDEIIDILKGSSI